MKNQCYICRQIFDTKEKLFDHLDVHARLKSQKITPPETIPQETKSQEHQTQTKLEETTIKQKGNQAICSDCGEETLVPFKPKEGRPVYCKECLMLHRTEKLKNLANEISVDNN